MHKPIGIEIVAGEMMEADPLYATEQFPVAIRITPLEDRPANFVMHFRMGKETAVQLAAELLKEACKVQAGR